MIKCRPHLPQSRPVEVTNVSVQWNTELGAGSRCDLTLFARHDGTDREWGSDSPPQIIKLIRGANSQERYEALARYYEGQAEEARKQVQNFKAQFECYVEQEKANKEAGIKLDASKLGSFCYRERDQYSNIAKENDALAEMYRHMAQEVAKQQHAGNPTAAK